MGDTSTIKDIVRLLNSIDVKLARIMEVGRFFVYDFIPLLGAILLVVLLIVWFYKTFIKTGL